MGNSNVIWLVVIVIDAGIMVIYGIGGDDEGDENCNVHLILFIY